MKKLVFWVAVFSCCFSASAQPPAAKPLPGDDLKHRIERLEERVQALENTPRSHGTPPAPSHGVHPEHPASPPGAAPEAGRGGRRLHVRDHKVRYLNIGYVWQKLTPSDEGLRAESDYGVSLSWGRTYYLHPKPLLGMIRIGLDWSWLDANYANYSLRWKDGTGSQYPEPSRYFNPEAHQADIGMSIGPSVTVNPVGGLKAAVYARFTPSCSLVILEEETHADFAGFFNVGASVAWNAFSVGLEGRWGKAKYGGASLAGEDDSERGPELPGTPRRLKTSSLRLYFGFRF